MRGTEKDTSIAMFPSRLTLRTPAGLPEAVAAAARHDLTSPSEFARRALVAACRAQGIELRADGRIECRATAGESA
jgi:hypothetical protein